MADDMQHLTHDATGPSATLAACPVPITHRGHVVLGHGSGGRLSARLLEEVFLPELTNPVLARLEDQAALDVGPLDQGERLAVTTDGFVVRPRFFPGGDLGSLAVHGTVNDLAVGGATPRWLTASFILEEGLSLDELRRLVRSMAAAARASGVVVVAGDTKVVERGKGDGVFISTTGVGILPAGVRWSAHHAQPGDRLLVSGTLGDHGVAVLSVRGDLSFETTVVSDSAPLHTLCAALRDVKGDDGEGAVRCVRDPTRGGLASALNEIASASGVSMLVDESTLPLREEVRGACELLGLDPLYVANEGKLVAVVRPEAAERALDVMRAHPLGRDAALIGEVTAGDAGLVRLLSAVGGERVLPLLAGEQLPRIC